MYSSIYSTLVFGNSKKQRISTRLAFVLLFTINSLNYDSPLLWAYYCYCTLRFLSLITVTLTYIWVRSLELHVYSIHKIYHCSWLSIHGNHDAYFPYKASHTNLLLENRTDRFHSRNHSKRCWGPFFDSLVRLHLRIEQGAFCQNPESDQSEQLCGISRKSPKIAFLWKSRISTELQTQFSQN